MARTKEFYVRDVRLQESGPPLVIGVPNNGLSIRVGDVFVASYNASQTVDDILSERPPPEPRSSASVTLTVVSISYPRSSVDELPSGHTGALALSGDGLEAIAKGRILRT